MKVHDEPPHMAAGSYPELDEIPAAPARGMSTRTQVPMPDVIRRLFKSFPLYEWPAAKAVASDADKEHVPSKPLLYIAPTWAGEWMSADPVSLRWQMELLLRGADFDVEVLRDPYWAPEGNTPFLHLPPATQSPVGRESGFPSLLGTSSLPHFVENHYPLERAELEEKSVWPSEAAAQESLAWRTLLYGRVTAGALLLALRCGAFTNSDTRQPLLRALAGGMLAGEATEEQRELARVSQLSTAGASFESIEAVYGGHYLADTRNPLALIPSYTVDFVGFLSGTSKHDAPDAETSIPPPSARIDQETILQQAAEGLVACAARLATDVDASTGEGWMLGAHRATSLDCLLFAALHTILSIPDDSPDAHSPLRLAVERHGVLAAYARRLRTALPGNL